MSNQDHRIVASPSKVVVIDDKIAEAEPLIRALSERDIPVLYFSGDKKELPKNPVNGVRIVFLDMRLAGMKRQPLETIASSLMGVIKRIISKDNGPYVVLAWTKHDELLEAFQENLRERGVNMPAPCFVMNMEKKDCMIDSTIDYEKVSAKLAEKLGDMPIISFFMNWEKMVCASAPEVISLLALMEEFLDIEEWRKKQNAILQLVAKAYSGSAGDKGIVSKTQSAMRVLNNILKDCIEKEVDKVDIEYLAASKQDDTSESTKAKINTRIHLRKLSRAKREVLPGNLYILSSFKELHKYIDYLPKKEYEFLRDFMNLPESVLETEKLSASCAICMLEVTPMCDYTHEKWRGARVLVGIIVPAEEEISKRIKKKAKFLFRTPLLELDGDLCYILFNYYYSSTMKFSRLKKEARYQMRLDLLADIQNGLANHQSRPGIIFLE